MLKCMVCGREMKQVNGGHLKTHGISAEEYKSMFPGAKLIVVSDKHKESARKTRIEWNKSEKALQTRIERNKSEKQKSLVSKSLKDKPKSEEHKQALKEAKANEDKKKRAEINGNNRRGKPQPEGFVQNMQINYGGVFRGRSGRREDLGNMYFRSRWEANYARVLKFKQIDYYFEPKSFLLDLPEGGQATYTPDFYLPQQDKYIEVKGYWMDHAKMKFDLFKQQYPELRIDVVDSKFYVVLEKQFKDKIKEWEC